MPSNVAGYLTPDSSPLLLEDDAFEDFMHDVFTGLTGLANDLVRPSWQPDPPNSPDRDTSWLAFAIHRFQADTYAAIIHDPSGDGSSELQRQETVETLLSAYGPQAGSILALIRDGLQLDQNRAALAAQGIGVTETGERIVIPAIAKNKWRRRVDMPLLVRRQINRVYEVLSLLSAQGTVHAEVIDVPILVTQTEP